ncbi:MAG: RelA/SpoT domain-containing protein [Acidobacteria bacterium]|nr:RelA/SpoT domain-containing protein [Acidobacteriota bacterium]
MRSRVEVEIAVHERPQDEIIAFSMDCREACGRCWNSSWKRSMRSSTGRADRSSAASAARRSADAMDQSTRRADQVSVLGLDALHLDDVKRKPRQRLRTCMEPEQPLGGTEAFDRDVDVRPLRETGAVQQRPPLPDPQRRKLALDHLHNAIEIDPRRAKTRVQRTLAGSLAPLQERDRVRRIDHGPGPAAFERRCTPPELRCSSVEYTQYVPSSRLATRAPRRSRCNAPEPQPLPLVDPRLGHRRLRPFGQIHPGRSGPTTVCPPAERQLYSACWYSWGIVPPSRSKWIAPLFSRAEVDRAGRLLAQNGAVADALSIGHALDLINNWRSSHSFPLNTFQVTLRKRVLSVSETPIVAQRLKRVPSIFGKLQRFPSMKLSRMQDIGGARAVLPAIEDVDRLRGIYRRRRTGHRFVGEKDYVRKPKTSGYRGIHLVYSYHSDRKTMYNGLQIELQLRTRRQHAWATAVETVGTFLGQSLKSSEGSEDWLRFFELIGSGFAIVEGGPPAENVPLERDALLRGIRDAASGLQVKEKLDAFRQTLRISERDELLRGHRYFLLVLQPEEESLRISAFRDGELTKATEAYLTQEKNLANTAGDTVLVASDSLESLRRAFPNYFLDTRAFVEEMDRLLA